MKNISKLLLVLFAFCLFGTKPTFAKQIEFSIQNGPDKYTSWETAVITFYIKRGDKEVTKKREKQEYTEIFVQQEKRLKLNKPDKTKTISLKKTKEGDQVSIQIFIYGTQSVPVDPFKREWLPNIVKWSWEKDFKEVKDGDKFTIVKYKPQGATEVTPSIPTAPIKQDDYRLKLGDWFSAQGEAAVEPTSEVQEQPTTTTEGTTETETEPATQETETIPK
jgi:hypothetical protein